MFKGLSNNSLLSKISGFRKKHKPYFGQEFIKFLGLNTLLIVVIGIYVYLTHISEPRLEELFMGLSKYVVNFQIWNLIFLKPGLASSVILILFTAIFIVFYREFLKSSVKLNRYSIVILTILLFANIFNLNLLLIPEFALFLVGLVIYILFSVLIYILHANKGRQEEVPSLDFLVKLVILPIGLIVYRILLIGYFILGLFTRKYSHLNKSKIFCQNLKHACIFMKIMQLLLTAGLITIVLQFVMYLLSKANPVFNDILYQPLQLVFKYVILMLEMSFGIITLIPGFGFILGMEIFQTKSLNSFGRSLQKALSYIFDVNFIRYLLWIILLIGFIFVGTNIYAITSYEFTQFAFKNGLNAFLYRGLWIDLLGISLGIVLLLFILDKTQAKYNKFFKLLKILVLALFFEAGVRLFELIVNFGSTTNRLLGIIVLLSLWIVTALIIFQDDIGNRRIELAFWGYLKALVLDVALYLILPWFIINLHIWGALLPYKTLSPQYFFNDKNIVYTYLYNSQLEKVLGNIKQAILFRDYVMCNVDSRSPNFTGRIIQTSCYDKLIYGEYNYPKFVEPAPDYYDSYDNSLESDVTLIKSLKLAARTGNLMSSNIMRRISSLYTKETCLTTYSKLDQELHLKLLQVLRASRDDYDLRIGILKVLNGAYKLRPSFFALRGTKILFVTCLNKRKNNLVIKHNFRNKGLPFGEISLYLRYDNNINAFFLHFKIPMYNSDY